MREKLRLVSRRAVNTRTGGILPHAASRHIHVGTDRLVHPKDGTFFAQGSIFPQHVRPGTVTRIEKYVNLEWRKMKAGHPTSLKIKSAGGAYRVTVPYGRFGVKEVGAFIRNEQVATVFPEKTKSHSYIIYKGKKIRKTTQR